MSSTEAPAYVDMKTLFGEVTLANYPQLRDAALTNEANTRQLEKLVDELDGKSSPKNGAKKGIALWILGRTQAAIEALEAAHPQEEIASIFLGRAYVDLERPKQAKVKYREALAKHPDSQPIAYGLIGAMLRLGEHEEASQVLDKAEKRFGQNAETVFLRAFHAELTGEYDEARQLYMKALQLDPRHGEAMFRLAHWHQTWGDEDEALELYENLRDMQPTYAHALLNLGNLYEDLQRYDQAVECYREVLASIPNHPRAIMFLSDAQASRTMFYDEDGERRADRQSAVLKIPVTDFELSVRSRNCLNKMNIKTLGDLIQMTEPELLAHKNFGETSLMEVKQMLAHHEDLRPQLAGDRGHADEAHGDHEVQERLPEHGHDPDRQEDRREGHDHVEAAHDPAVDAAPEVAGHEAQRHAEHDGDPDGHEADHERVARAVEHAREDVVAGVVGAGEERARRDARGQVGRPQPGGRDALVVELRVGIDAVGVVAGERRGQPGQDDPHGDDHAADPQALVPERPAQPAAHAPPMRTRGSSRA